MKICASSTSSGTRGRLSRYVAEELLHLAAADLRHAEPLLLQPLGEEVLPHFVAVLPPDPAERHPVVLLELLLGAHLLDPLLDHAVQLLLYLFVAHLDAVVMALATISFSLIIDCSTWSWIPGVAGSRRLFMMIELDLGLEFRLQDRIVLDDRDDPVQGLCAGSRKGEDDQHCQAGSEDGP